MHARVKEFLQMEPDDPQTVFDLRGVKCPEKKTKYEVFRAEAEKFIRQRNSCIDNHRHCQVCI